MQRQSLTVETLVPILSRLLEQPVRDLRITNRVHRAYSNILFMEANTATGIVRLAAKTWDGDLEFEKQVTVLKMARAVCVEDEDVCVPYLGAVKSERLLLMPEVRDARMDTLCRFSLQHPVHIRYLRHKRTQLEAACQKAGRWLHAWHASTAQKGELAQAFSRYLSNGRDPSDRLSRRDQDRIWALVKSVEPGVTCIPHGDFTPLNLFWSSPKLTVVDFGLLDWERTTPWWDVVCFEIGLVRALRFSLKGFGTWIPGMCESALGSFRDGYGGAHDGNLARLACLAVRHLVLHAGDVHSGRGYSHRAEWHRQQLVQALAEADNPHLHS